MTNIREFIKNLGDKAPAFFDTKDTTVARWLKTGNIPFKAVEKVMMASDALRSTNAVTSTETVTESLKPIEGQPEQPVEDQIDPLTHLPVNMDKRLPTLNPGHSPQVIEMSPTEQSWGLNLTRPGRLPQRGALPPMKIRKENGQDVPYTEQPKPITVLPPDIGNEPGWGKPNEPAKPKEQTKSVSQETLP